MFITWMIGVVALLTLLDGFRLRNRISKWDRLPSLARERENVAIALVGPGVHMPREIRNQASQWMEVERLDALDLIPDRLSTLQMMSLAIVLDGETFAQSPFARGRSALHALMLSPELAARAGFGEAVAANSAVMARAAHQAKRHAPRSTRLALVQGLHAQPENLAWRRQVFMEALGGSGTVAFYAQPILHGLLLLSLANPLGWAWVLAYHLQPCVALMGQGLRTPDLLKVTFLRLPLELLQWTQAWRTAKSPDNPLTETFVESQRRYGEAFLKDPSEWFHPRKKRCPLCKSSELSVFLETPDLYQHKPGTFVLEECGDCGHVFQNPQLNSEGLTLYYGDFYEGLGESLLEDIFEHEGNPYGARADMVSRHVESPPEKWLDVGAGHGHFCAFLRDRFPEARLEGLDLGSSVDAAHRRTWMDAAHRGFFPELAQDLRESYHVVSMSHYLEHTVEPQRELDAARVVLKERGLLFIEVPDPESKLGRFLGKFWLPWFQPQHLHLLSLKNLSGLLSECGFELIQVERGEAHQAVDFSFAWILFLGKIAPGRNEPWLKRPTALQTYAHRIVWTLGFPLLVVLKGVDLLLAPVFSRPGWSNTYRVIARRSELENTPHGKTS